MLNIHEDIILNREVRQKHIEVVCEHASLRDYADNWGKGVEFRAKGTTNTIGFQIDHFL